MENTIKWVAFLSNGETIVEGKGIATKVDGELSPWHKLQEHLKKNALTITGLSLWIGDRHLNLPSNKPKFQGEIPIGYNMFKRGAMDVAINTGKTSETELLYVCIEAIYKDFTLQLWISGKDPDKSWTNIVKNKSE